LPEYQMVYDTEKEVTSWFGETCGDSI